MNAGEVLGEGWRLFLRGLITVFPWILAAELLQLLPFFGASGSLLTADLGQWFTPASLLRAVIGGVSQAFLYGIAIARLGQMTNESTETGWRIGLRAVPALFIGYLAYEIMVIVGVFIALLFFVLGCFIAGLYAGLVICLLPLWPTAWCSTVFVLFAFPGVLERRGPLAALTASRQRVVGNWARATLVITVPALALLALWAAENHYLVFKVIPALFALFLNSSADDIVTQLQLLEKNVQVHAQLPLNSILHTMWIVIGAFIWWYTLAVLYAEYRALGAERRD